MWEFCVGLSVQCSLGQINLKKELRCENEDLGFGATYSGILNLYNLSGGSLFYAVLRPLK